MLSGVTTLAPGLIKINKSEHMRFTIDNVKNGNTRKEEIKANETKIYPARLRHTTEKHKISVFRNTIGKIENYSVKSHKYLSVAPVAHSQRTMNSLCFA